MNIYVTEKCVIEKLENDWTSKTPIIVLYVLLDEKTTQK